MEKFTALQLHTHNATHNVTVYTEVNKDTYVLLNKVALRVCKGVVADVGNNEVELQLEETGEYVQVFEDAQGNKYAYYDWADNRNCVSYAGEELPAV